MSESPHSLHENKTHLDLYYKIGVKALVLKDGILHKSQRHDEHDPWTITCVNTNGTIRAQC